MSKFDSKDRARSPDDRMGGPNNDLRIDLYRHLFPQIQQQDQASGAQGFTLHWNDPSAQWNSGNIKDVWNSVGLSPIIQTLFHTLETMEGEDVGILESLDVIIDPFEAPVELLDDIAASFGYHLEDSLSEDMKRVVVQGLFHAYKALGKQVGFKIFYRMIGFEIINIFPLFKKDIHEQNNDYSRDQYLTSSQSEAVGPAGNVAYQTVISGVPIQPGTFRLTDGTSILKDQPDGFTTDGLVGGGVALGDSCACRGTIVGPTGLEVGTINYGTGQLVVNFGAPTVGPVTASWEQIDEEWPYHAARLDIEILLNPAGSPIPLVDTEVVGNLLDRLDEVRPIHVLLRAVALAFELEDTAFPVATDQTACTQILRDTRDPFEASPGRDFLSMIDDGPTNGPDEMSVKLTGVGTDLHMQVLEDFAEGICPGLDLLEIDADTIQIV